MRSQSILHRSRSLIRTSAVSQSRHRFSTRTNAIWLVNEAGGAHLNTWINPHDSRGFSSAIPTNPSEPSDSSELHNLSDPSSSDAPPASEVSQTEEKDLSSDLDKPRRRVRASSNASVSKEADSPPSLPSGLNILWAFEEGTAHDASESPNDLPREIFEEALNNLHIALHPQTQHRATYSSSSGPPVEPTLALYCPIEGGDYIVDKTVHELASSTGSEVVVLDAVQLSAGESGHFGTAANAIQFTKHPLHFPSVSSQSPGLGRSSGPTEEPDEDEYGGAVIPPPMTFHVMASPSSSRSRAYVSGSSRGSSPSNKIKSFFDELVNIPSPCGTSSSERRPRIIYIKDFPTLAPSSAVWYPPLLAAVRQRRQGPIARLTSPISNPMVIVFGITPSIVPTASTSPTFGQQGLVNFMLSRSQPQAGMPSQAKSGKMEANEWGEDESSDRARERRFRERLRRWEKGDPAFLEELPSLATDKDGRQGDSKRPELIVVEGSSLAGLPAQLGSLLSGGISSQNRYSSPENEISSRFFRTSVIVPAARSPQRERLCRMARRREINQLTMRMGLAAIGGVLERLEDSDLAFLAGTNDAGDDSERPIEQIMWDDWGKRVEVWASVLQIADRALGSVITWKSGIQGNSSLDPTLVPWPAVHKAWVAHRSAQDSRKELSKRFALDSSRRLANENKEDNEGEEVGLDDHDAVVERIKQDPDLDPHESKLLHSIVDPVTMPTSFDHVHLPTHTIDSVRTIVSLPLLHPAAFQQGVLKQHAMTGCLLFGPPGTGKTLVVRALAKEAGSRMMVISPSDVMDMYVGEGEKLVRAVFSLARRLSPCVVFLDEIDALFGARMSARESGGAFAHRGVITEFMQEMDGLKTSKDDRVVVIGATNRPFDLDDAVLRRLPRRLLVDLPGEQERKEILKIILRDEILSPDIDLQVLARKTASFSGSDLKHLCVSAALDAVKEVVEVPWKTSKPSNTTSLAVEIVSDLPSDTSAPSISFPDGEVIDAPPASQDSDASVTQASPQYFQRTLHFRNFARALKEITPSASESLGSLAELRKWNDEFGEGGKNKSKRQFWGKDRFGFIDNTTQRDRVEGGVIPEANVTSSSYISKEL